MDHLVLVGLEKSRRRRSSGASSLTEMCVPGMLIVALIAVRVRSYPPSASMHTKGKLSSAVALTFALELDLDMDAWSHKAGIKLFATGCLLQETLIGGKPI